LYLRLHWTLNPIFAKDLSYGEETEEPTSPWYEEQKQRATSLQEVSQELDIDYEASMAGKVFADWDDDIQIIPALEYDPNLPAPDVAWDFGLDQTAMIWVQYDRENRTYNVIDEYVNDGQGKGTSIYHYLDILDSKPYPNGIHYGDPYSGENKNHTSGESNASILRRHGYVFKSERTKITTRISAARNILANVRVSDSCKLTIEMMRNWQFVKPKTGNASTGTPQHNEFSHIGDAFTYYAYNYKKNINKKRPQRKQYTMSSGGVVG